MKVRTRRPKARPEAGLLYRLVWGKILVDRDPPNDDSIVSDYEAREGSITGPTISCACVSTKWGRVSTE